MWMWDQGRLQYSKIDNIYRMASVLSDLNGVALDDDDDHIKDELIKKTGLPFLPSNYSAWRNYARTIKVLGLASKIDGRLKVTGLCQKLASTEEKILPDDYLTHISKVFSYPSPSFKGYTPSEAKTFPLIAIIKHLIAKGETEIAPSINAQEVSSVLIGNNVNGLEDISFYKALTETSYTSSKTDIRHIREMLQFISQLSFLFYDRGNLTCDITSLTEFTEDELNNIFRPIITTSDADKELEIQQLFNLDVDTSIDTKDAPEPEDTVFTEGKKVRATHLRTERNREAIKAYFASFTDTKESLRCDICKDIVSEQFPWMEKLIEVHHLLPLSSPLHSGKKGTSVDDLVGLCPNCHRATHSYYRKFLKEQGTEDFLNEEQAKTVYQQVKDEYIPKS
jgi:predicted HNH restriction endonuclease